MTQRRFIPRMLTLLGLVLSALILTMVTLTLVQAQGDAVTITKETDQAVIRGSSTVTFTIAITNTGIVTLTNVTVSDPLASNCNSGPFELAPDEGSTSYTCTHYVTADFTNTVTVTGVPEGSSDVVSNTAMAFVDVINPVIDIEKTPEEQTVTSSDDVSFTLTVQNTGDVELNNVTVTDALCDSVTFDGGDDNSDNILQTSETWSYTCAVEDVAVDFTNSATVTGTPPVGSDVEDEDSAEVYVINPGIDIEKTPEEQTVTSGDDVNFTLTVQNPGDVELSDVTVTDALCDSLTFSGGDGNSDNILQTSETWTYACPRTYVTDGFINSATVTGTPPVGEDVTDADAAKVRLDETGTCPTDMLAYWNLDETSSGTYDDFYYGHDGECAGPCPTPTTAGRINGGQVFDGGDEIDVPTVPGDDSFNWDATDNFSIEFWMRTDSASTCSGNQVVVGRDDSSSSLQWWAGCRNGGQAEFYVRNAGGGITALAIGSTDIADGAWHHVVAVRDASADRIRIYVDGVEESSAPVTDFGFDFQTTALNIGHMAGGYHFDGTVDEVALYDSALSSDDIRQHYNKGLAERWYCQEGPYPPIIVSTPVTEANSGRLYTYDVEADGDPDPTYALVTTPTGMTIDTATGLISWVPTPAQVGSHAVEVQASNGVNPDATQPFTITVTEGTICPTNLIAYWKLDETSGSTYDDFYDGHDGGCAGSCPTPASGQVNGGQEFNGSNTGIDVPADEDFDWGAPDSFSIEFWMQTDSASTCSGNEVIVGRDDSSSSLQWWTGCQSGGQAAFYLRNAGGTSTAWVTETTDITDGAWHHVVAVRDADADAIRIYVDGSGNSASVTDFSLDFPTVALNIGHMDGGFHFDGTLDEVALYGRALSPDEIQQHYNDGETGPGYCISPDITVEKAANSTAIASGDTVVYTYTLTNPGDVPLSDISLSDDKCSPVTLSAGSDSNSNSQLDLSETWIYTCSTVLSTDTTNTATATGSHYMDGTVSDTDTVFVGVMGSSSEVFLPIILKEH